MSRRRHQQLCAGLALVLAVSFVAPPAHAQRPAAQSAETKLHFQRAVKLYSEEDYRGALVEFRRAYELSNNYVILYNLGQTQFQLRDYAGALQSFEKYVSTGGSQIAATRRADVEKDIEDLKGRIAKLTVEASQPGATISIDDVVVGKSPLSAPVVVSAGVRKVQAAKEGLPTVTKSVEIAGGDTVSVKLDFPAPVVAPAVTTPPPVREEPVQPRTTSPFVYVGYGVAGVGLGVGVTFGLVALGTKSSLDGRCTDHVCPTDQKSKGDTLTLQATVSTIGFGVGIVGAVVGTYFLLAPPSSTTRAATSSASLAPRITPWFVGTAGGVEGRF